MTLDNFITKARTYLPKPEMVDDDKYTVCLNVDTNDTDIIIDYYVYFEKEPREKDGWRYNSHHPLYFK